MIRWSFSEQIQLKESECKWAHSDKVVLTSCLSDDHMNLRTAAELIQAANRSCISNMMLHKRDSPSCLCLHSLWPKQIRWGRDCVWWRFQWISTYLRWLWCSRFFRGDVMMHDEDQEKVQKCFFDRNKGQSEQCAVLFQACGTFLEILSMSRLPNFFFDGEKCFLCREWEVRSFFIFK